ncbi:MAG: hypothetical protein KDH15_00725 [Rhodocyclaceae bacterium]|nr:hypothetical protein [Rhodocyclaceae bacterium]
MSTFKYSAGASTSLLIGLSISYQRDNLLARGLGLEHLREMLLRLARELLRQGANLAYGGHWQEAEDNFTYDLLRLVSAEQQERQLAQDLDADEEPRIGRLYNHSAWPAYLSITPQIEAQWINCCRIVRIDQAQAGIAEADRSPDDGTVAAPGSDGHRRRLRNAAIALSAMRRIATVGTEIAIPHRSRPERVPPLAARILLGGKVQQYSGFVPGIFEEALLTLDARAPLYVLGGFGGAAEVIARAIDGSGKAPPPELTEAWQHEHTPALATLADAAKAIGLPPGVRDTKAALKDLAKGLAGARRQPAKALRTGLSDDETRELMRTTDMRRATQLVLTGLHRGFGMHELPG